MKKLFALYILAVFVFVGCAKSAHKPETSPNTSKPESTSSVSQPAQSGGGSEKAQEEPQNQKTEQSEDEKIPLIELNKPVSDNGKPVQFGNQKIIETINTGITNAFKDFGYSTDVKVSDEFIKRVAFYIRYFSEDEKGSRFFRRAMARGEQYFPMIKEVFENQKLPTALIYLPVVESGFNTSVKSRASAVGMWQFMRGTARMYGLKVTRSVDERKDPVKATNAAARYLNDLLSMFGMEDPFLALCAYNAGEGKILNALRNISYTERSFWTLVQKKLLRQETDEYIPRLLAVILINHDPARYTLASKAIALEPNEAEDIEIINALHSPREDLNDEEEKTTPVDREPEVNVEKTVIPEPETTPNFYIVKKGETLFRISQQFGVSVDDLKRWNNLPNNIINPGQKILLYSTSSSSTGNQTAKTVYKGSQKLIYTVNQGDTLVKIALLFKGVSARNIMRWNKMKGTRIHPGRKLTINSQDRIKKVLIHTVKKGETPMEIARKYKLRVEYVISLNGLLSSSKLKPGQQLKIYIF